MAVAGKRNILVGVTELRRDYGSGNAFAPEDARATGRKGAKVGRDDRTNKKAEVIALMRRASGATLAAIMQLTGWQAHTVRGFVSILGSKGRQVVRSSNNSAGERTYRISK